MPGWPADDNLVFRTAALQVRGRPGGSVRNPVRILLTIIATLMSVGRSCRSVGVMFTATSGSMRRACPMPHAPAAERPICRISTRPTVSVRRARGGELLLADMRRKEAAEREQAAQQRQPENRSAPARVSRKSRAASVRRWQPPISVPKRRRNDSCEDEVRRKEAQEKAQQEAELRKREAEIACFRSRAYQSDE